MKPKTAGSFWNQDQQLQLLDHWSWLLPPMVLATGAMLSRDLSFSFYCASPKAIIQATNAGKHRADLLLANLHRRVQQQAQAARLPSLPPSPPPADPARSPLPPAPIVPPPLLPARVLSAPVAPVDAPATKSLKPPPEPNMSGPSSGKAPLSSDEKADLTYIHMLMETQHNSMIQSQQDCAALAERMTRFEEASAQCITWLEEAIMLLSTKREDLANRQSLSSAVSLGLYGDSRTQGGGKLNIIARERMTMITTKEDFDEGMNKL
ncbi:hypothetical protein PCANC_04621 [Puccinia coronata f. sp. avenae]|uniref:Uncharacterized protein n=1 Tax=Puccinia coronata f. sp. avenae TaxID=200324 RepID=A0A2N5W094_9BASI|nr:hypothetical protein PCANC_04621 [Puccinia coronata f. sp. avenae]